MEISTRVRQELGRAQDTRLYDKNEDKLNALECTVGPRRSAWLDVYGRNKDKELG